MVTRVNGRKSIIDRGNRGDDEGRDGGKRKKKIELIFVAS